MGWEGRQETGGIRWAAGWLGDGGIESDQKDGWTQWYGTQTQMALPEGWRGAVSPKESGSGCEMARWKGGNARWCQSEGG